MQDSEMLKIVNSRGETYVLHPNYDEFGVLSIDGLGLPDVNVNVSENGTSDGGEHNSSRLSSRNIVIYLVMFGWTEAERRKLHRMFPAKSEIELYYRNSQFSVHTTVFVKNIDVVISYYNRTKVRIELVAPDSYLHADDKITAVASGTPLTCSITNDADCEVGFDAEITISTTDEPELNIDSTQSETAAYLGSHTFFLLPSGYIFDDVNLASETFNIYVNGVLKTSADGFHVDLLTLQSGHDLLYIESDNGGLANKQIVTEHIVVQGKSVTDMRYYESGSFNIHASSTEYDAIINGIPSWFDKDKDKIICKRSDGAGGTVDANVSSIVINHQNSDGTYQVTFTIAGLPVDFSGIGYLYIYGSISKVDVHSDTITRDVTQGWWQSRTYTERILSPTIPAYDPSTDVFRVYMGNRLMQNGYVFETVTKSDGTTADMFVCLNGDITDTITWEAISSSSGTDIREYTQAQIDEALCLVDTLTITNETTGEYMAFPGYQFKNGDKIRISTVPGQISAVVVESNWLEPGKSLLAEVIQNGTFFKLKSGKNNLSITADTNADYVSASFSAERLYGGV